MRFTLQPITTPEAREISRWRYPEPYAMYDGNPASISSLLDERFAYHSVRDEHDELAGYFCFGEDARIPEGRKLGLYDEEVLDVGLGMKPGLTGKRLGLEFVLAGLRFAENRFPTPAFRLTVATFNQRAVCVYEKAGFEVAATFGSSTTSGGLEWLLMRRLV